MKKYILLLFLYTLSSEPAQGQVAVIAHKSVSIDKLEAATVSDIYTLKTTKWKDGSKVILFNLKSGGTVKNKFYRFIGQKTSELRKRWMRLQLTGEGKPPRAFKSEEALIAQVASTPGAIGYVSRDKITPNVKVLAIIN